MQPASAKWYDRRDYVFVEFCVEDSKDVEINFEKEKFTFRSPHTVAYLSGQTSHILVLSAEYCLGGAENVKHFNEVNLYNAIDPNDSRHKRTDRSVLCYLRKGESGQAWPRLTKEKPKLNWLKVDFNNWRDWDDDPEEEDLSSFEKFSQMMNNMGGDDDGDIPDVDGMDDDGSQDSDDEKMPDLE